MRSILNFGELINFSSRIDVTQKKGIAYRFWWIIHLAVHSNRNRTVSSILWKSRCRQTVLKNLISEIACSCWLKPLDAFCTQNICSVLFSSKWYIKLAVLSLPRGKKALNQIVMLMDLMEQLFIARMGKFCFRQFRRLFNEWSGALPLILRRGERINVFATVQ